MMSKSEIDLAHHCADVLTRSSAGLAPLASTLDSLAELLRALAAGEVPTDDLKARIEELAPLVRGVDYEQVTLAMKATETLLLSMHNRGEF